MKDIFKDYIGKEVRLTLRNGEERVGTVSYSHGQKYPYLIKLARGGDSSYTPSGCHFVGLESGHFDVIKIEPVKKDILKEFVGKKVVATRRDGERVVGVIEHNVCSNNYPYILTEQDGYQFTYTPEGSYWTRLGEFSQDIVKIELFEEPEPQGKWGQVVCNTNSTEIRWKNPVEGKEEELLRVLRDCYGFYPNAEDYVVNRIKAIWE